MIISFADQVTEKIFMGESLTRKEINQLGDLNLNKAQERLAILNRTNEKDLLTLSFLNYHRLQGTERYSIDANSRRSKWRITFSWNKESRVDVQLVKIEDTHK